MLVLHVELSLYGVPLMAAFGSSSAMGARALAKTKRTPLPWFFPKNSVFAGAARLKVTTAVEEPVEIEELMKKQTRLESLLEQCTMQDAMEALLAVQCEGVKAPIATAPDLAERLIDATEKVKESEASATKSRWWREIWRLRGNSQS